MSKLQWLVVSLSTVALALGVSALSDPRVKAAGVCCIAGSDCPGDDLCCDYNVLGAEPCNSQQEKEGYCLAVETCRMENE